MTNESWLSYLAKFLRLCSSTLESDSLSIKKADIVFEALELNNEVGIASTALGTLEKWEI